MKPAHTPGKDRGPVEIAGLEHACRFVGAIVKNHGRPHTLGSVAGAVEQGRNVTAFLGWIGAQLSVSLSLRNFD